MNCHKGLKHLLAVSCAWVLTIAAVCGTSTVALAERHVLQPVGRIDAHCEWIGYISFSPDGRKVASSCWKTLSVWDFRNGSLVREVPASFTDFISADWKYVLTSDSVEDFSSGSIVGTVPIREEATHALSPDSRYLAESTWDKNGSVAGTRILDITTGKQVSAFGSHRARALAFSPNGRILASAHSDLVVLRDWSDGKQVGKFRGGGELRSLAFSNNGRLLATGSTSGDVQVWDVRRKKRILLLNLGGIYVSPPAFSPNGRFVAVGIYGTGSVWLIDIRKRRLVDHWAVSDHSCASVAFSPDGRYLITASTTGLYLDRGHWKEGGGIRVFRVRYN